MGDILSSAFGILRSRVVTRRPLRDGATAVVVNRAVIFSARVAIKEYMPQNCRAERIRYAKLGSRSVYETQHLEKTLVRDSD